MGGIFGFDSTKTNETVSDIATTTQSGIAYGGASGSRSVGGGATGNVTGSLRIGNNSTAAFDFTTPEAWILANTSVATVGNIANSAISSNANISLAALAGAQSLSTLAVSSGQRTATQALETLQLLGSREQVTQSGGSISDISQPLIDAAAPPKTPNKTLIIAGTIFGLALLFWIYKS